MWVRFLADFDFSPKALGGRVTKAYKAGREVNVTRECANIAIPIGKAEALPPRKKAENVEDRRG